MTATPQAEAPAQAEARAAAQVEARAAAERAARVSYGRLVALLAAPTGDLAGAEDALSGAFEEALRRWPSGGVPKNPEGWLLTVARNRQRDVWRSAAARTTTLEEGDVLVDPLAQHDPLAIGERRLELLFVCAHPAIEQSVRTPLILQAAMGFDAKQIARAFAVPAPAMAQRLVRAKRRIKDARIAFAAPDRRAMAERLPAVLEAVYGCAAIDWRGGPESLAGEAQYLAVTLAVLLEDEAEAWGLAALTTLTLARPPREVFVPLAEQDPADWDERLIAEGESYLRRAQAPGPLGRFQLEAAIQAVHVDRRRTGITDWAALNTLYAALLAVAPGLGARVAAAVVLGQLHGPEAGLAALPASTRPELPELPERPEPAAPEFAVSFQPYWAARADLLARAGRDASAAYARAIELAEQAGDEAVATFLRVRASASATTSLAPTPPPTPPLPSVTH